MVPLLIRFTVSSKPNSSFPPKHIKKSLWFAVPGLPLFADTWFTPDGGSILLMATSTVVNLFIGLGAGAICMWLWQRLMRHRREDVSVDVLLKQRHELEGFLDEANDLIQIVNHRGAYLYVNKTWCRTLGYSREEAQEMNILQVIHPRHHDHCVDLLRDLTNNPKSEALELTFLTKSGDEVYLDGHMHMHEDTRGNMLSRGIFRNITKRREVEREKEAADRKYRLIAANSNDMIGFYRDEKLVYISPSVERTLGYSPDQFIEVNRIDYIHPDDRELVLSKSLERPTGEEEHAPFEYRFRRKDGTYCWLEATSNSITDHNGEKLNTFIARDITHRKETELELTKIQDLLEQTNEVAMVGGWEADLVGNQVIFSDVAKKILGLPEDYQPTLEEAMAIYKEGRGLQVVNDAIYNALKYGKHFDIEVSLNRQDKDVIWVRMIGKSVMKDNWCVRLYGSFQDINERKQIEQRIRESEAKFRSIVENANDIVFSLSLDGVFTYVSPNWEEILGHRQQDVIGTSLVQYVHQDYVKHAFQTIHSILSSGKKIQTEPYLVRHQDGTWRWHITNAAPVLDENGRISSFVGIAHDVTQKIAYEDSLRKAKEEAEAASKAKSLFLANMSHEIRTPLNSVIGFTDLLIKTDLNESQRQYMQSVHHSANALLDLINDILDFSKIEAGKLELSYERTDLWELAEMLVDIVRFKIQEEKVELLLNLDPHLPRYAWVDPVRLRQILMNLASNAAKFTEEGEIEISLRPAGTTDQGQDDMSIQFSVRDTGIGIQPDKQSEIFEAFKQEDGSTTRKYGGTGLGLAISNQLLKLMGSALTLESEPNVGSCFSFTLVCRTEVHHMSESDQDFCFERVLIVDDHPKNRLILADMLDLLEVSHGSASDGLKALEALEKNTYDVVILDYHMPNMDGMETIKRIRAHPNPAIRNVTIIFLHSTSEDREVAEARRAYQLQRVISKPITIRILQRTLLDIGREETAPSDTLQAAPEETLHQNKQSFVILVADDNRINLMLARTMISKVLPQSQILEALNGKEAVDEAFAKKPDLIFMDIQMPQMSGYEATRLIRDHKATGHIPIIALTAGTVKGERERCLAAGMNDYLSKPILLKDVENILHRYLSAANYQRTNWDFEGLRTALGDESTFQQILLLARENLADLQQDLRDDVELQNAEQLSHTAHTIRGVLLNLGVNDLAEEAGRIEQSAKKRHILPVDQINEFQRRLQVLGEALQEEVELNP